jgi:hypothetical protein
MPSPIERRDEITELEQATQALHDAAVEFSAARAAIDDLAEGRYRYHAAFSELPFVAVKYAAMKHAEELEAAEKEKTKLNSF